MAKKVPAESIREGIGSLKKKLQNGRGMEHLKNLDGGFIEEWSSHGEN